MTQAKCQFAFPPAALDESMAAYYVGNLSITAFRAEMKRYGVKPMRMTPKRIAYHRDDLDDYLARKRGTVITSAQEALDALDGCES